jgi:hypothetical protein
MKAFPIAMMEGNEDDLGMDLRDYFAAKVMQAIIVKDDKRRTEIQEIALWVGHYAYTVADAMMEARK